jgi:hypothetical protein
MKKFLKRIKEKQEEEKRREEKKREEKKVNQIVKRTNTSKSFSKGILSLETISKRTAKSSCIPCDQFMFI